MHGHYVTTQNSVQHGISEMRLQLCTPNLMFPDSAGES
jgi:hypothetical protein